MSAAAKLDKRPLEDEGGHSAWIFERLPEVSLLSDIKTDEAALRALSAIMTLREFKAGEEIIREGTTGPELFILVEGRASVFKSTPQGDEYKVAIFDGSKNITFGEGGLIENDSRTATIRTDTDCTCIALDRETFEKFSQTYPQWALPVYRRIAYAVMARLKKTNNDMLLLYNALVAEIRGK